MPSRKSRRHKKTPDLERLLIWESKLMRQVARIWSTLYPSLLEMDSELEKLDLTDEFIG
jgi:hypothetical protein